MAANAYIRTAANQLRSAAAEVQREIRTVQVETDRAKSQLSNDISSAMNEQATLRTELIAIADPGRKYGIEARLRELDQVVTQKKQEVGRQSTDAANTVQSKTSLFNDLESTASQLESMAAAAG
jgi:hypothetical protein